MEIGNHWLHIYYTSGTAVEQLFNKSKNARTCNVSRSQKDHLESVRSHTNQLGTGEQCIFYMIGWFTSDSLLLTNPPSVIFSMQNTMHIICLFYIIYSIKVSIEVINLRYTMYINPSLDILPLVCSMEAYDISLSRSVRLWV